MQFIATNINEYLETVNKIVDSGIYKESFLVNVFNIEDCTVLKEPTEFPVIVSVNIEEWGKNNRNYYFSSIDFIYIGSILTATQYIQSLSKLAELDVELASLENICETSGLIIIEMAQKSNEIRDLETKLF